MTARCSRPDLPWVSSLGGPAQTLGSQGLRPLLPTSLRAVAAHRQQPLPSVVSTQLARVALFKCRHSGPQCRVRALDLCHPGIAFFSQKAAHGRYVDQALVKASGPLLGFQTAAGGPSSRSFLVVTLLRGGTVTSTSATLSTQCQQGCIRPHRQHHIRT